MPALFAKVLRDQRDLLLFRPFKPDLAAHGHLYLGWGLLTAWLVGIGRYWDHPKAQLWQYLGLGSVAYVFVMALILWLLIWPLKPANWSYRNVLVFVMLTSLPAILYAIPVEQFMGREAAAGMNVAFLLIVATWRVTLLFLFLRRSAQLSRFAMTVAALLPLALIVTVLTMLNLEHAVFEIMGGLRPEDKTQNDASFGVLLLITVLAWLAAPLLLAAYLYLVYRARRPSLAAP